MISREDAREIARLARQAHSIYEDRGDSLVCLCGVGMDGADAMVNHVFEAVVEEVLTLDAAPSDTAYALLDDRANRPAAERLLGVFATCSMAMAEANRITARLLGPGSPALHWAYDDPPEHLTIPSRRPFGRRWRAQVHPGELRALHWSIRAQPLLGEPATLTLRDATVTEPDQKGDADR